MESDVRLAYTERGTGLPLVLLHGNGENREYFHSQMEPFSACFRVIAVDTRGHGATPRGRAPFTLAQFAEDLRALLDDLGIEKTDLLGYSDGGNIALLFALQSPERVRRLVLNGANLCPSGMKWFPWLAIDIQYALALALSRLSPKTVRRRELLGLMATQPHIRPPALKALALPVLVIAGTHDVIRQRHTREIAHNLKNSHLVLIRGGHAIAQESPAAFNAAVLAFLTDPPGALV
ncbi:MAG TPA: alpha/beta fold hydrolase [Candidatus Limiplasma sp.]|nr:alpha/beta fold hydrolase [Candidatus Limiplasma sp.]HPS81289.1 alpha/beta fold hydrolase [Candidatus Limiplasma sp.]